MDKENTYDLLSLLHRLEWLLRRLHLRRHHERGPMGSTHRGQGRILSLLKLQPTMSQRELGGILDIRSQSLGELLAKLERAGYITRTVSEADRRVQDIQLTDTGRAAAETEDLADPLDNLFDVLSADESETFTASLRKLIDHLETQVGDEPEGEPGFDPRERLRGFREHGPHGHGPGPGRGHGRGFGPGDHHRW